MVNQVSSYNSDYASSYKTASNQKSFSEVLSQATDYDTSSSVNNNSESSLLSKLDNLMLPTLENLQELTSELEEKLSEFLSESGISSDPPFDLCMHHSSSDNSVVVEGDREDIEEITKLLNEDPEMKQMISNVYAIGSHVINMAEGLEFQQEYIESDNPESVVAKYSYLFNDNREMHSFSLRYADNSLQILSDNQEWNNSV
ncbi:MAG: hypothetical protein PVH88_26085 [Ignavibacteria bacterium]|jgi:hypothetical protein